MPRVKYKESEFQSWYKAHAKRLGLDENPDDPRHYYDYRAAYKAGAGPDSTGHWPSKYKREGHPRMVVNGINTKTGKRVARMPAGNQGSYAQFGGPRQKLLRSLRASGVSDSAAVGLANEALGQQTERKKKRKLKEAIMAKLAQVGASARALLPKRP